MSASSGWAERRPPSLAAFEAMAEAAFAALPTAVRRWCDGVVVRVAEFPDDETMDELDLDGPFDILGLFRGSGLAQGAFADRLETGQMPSAVWLYRRPILDAWAEGEDELGALVTHVLVHEIGHHMGLSDDDMARIEAMSADPV